MAVKTANISLTLGVGASIPSIAQQIEAASIIEATATRLALTLDTTEDDIRAFIRHRSQTTVNSALDVCEWLKTPYGITSCERWLRSSSRR